MFPDGDRIITAVRTRWPLILIGTTVTALLWWFDAFSFLLTDTLGGRDLVGSYAFTWLMQQHLLKATIIDWSNQWMLGFPAFALYPPLFFLATAGIHLVTAGVIGLQPVFLLIVFATVFLLPPTAYLTFHRHVPRREAFFIGFYTIYFLFVYPPVSHAYQTLAVGLVAQGFALFLLILLFHRLFADGMRSRVITGILLGLTVLAHPFVGMIGGIAAMIHAVVHRRRASIIPLLIGGLIAAPWLFHAARYLPYTSTYTMEPAVVGTFILLLLPLILLGGVRTQMHQTLLATFSLTFLVAIIDVPGVTQEVRFFTYALLLGTILAGAGAHRACTRLAARFDARLVTALLLVPVIGLSLHAGLSPMWQAQTDVAPVTGMLAAQEPGRVLVESQAEPLSDVYVLQELIPLRTDHTVVNELHLDASSSANAILTVEHWVSANPIKNPLCATCNTTAPPSLVAQRLDDLGIRYVLAATPNARDRLSPRLAERASSAGYTLYENPDVALVEPLSVKPVALVGSHSRWQAVNQQLISRNSSRHIVWRRHPPQHRDRFSAVVRMDDVPVATILQRVAEAPRIPVVQADVQYTVTEDRIRINASRPAPVHVRFSYFPTHTADRPVYAATFNTMIVYAGNRTRVNLR